MLSAQKIQTPQGGERHSKSRQSASTKKGQQNDMWQENIHFAQHHEIPEDAERLVDNAKRLNDHDKFVEYIRHVENSKRLRLQSQKEEMKALANAGQQTNQRFIELTYVVAENDEEDEQRDYSRVAKYTAPAPELIHSNYACIGPSTCLKQKNIRKIFPVTLKQCEEFNKANINAPGAKKTIGGTNTTAEQNQSLISLNSRVNSTAPVNDTSNVSGEQRMGAEREDNLLMGSPLKKTTPLIRKQGLAGEIEDKVTSDFMKLIDYMEDQRSGKKTDALFREKYRKRSVQPGVKQFSQSNFILPSQTPSKTNILSSSNTFRTLTAQKLQRHTASTLTVRKNLNKGTPNPSFVSLGSQSEVRVVLMKTEGNTRLPAVRAGNQSAIRFNENPDPYQFNTPQKMPLRQQQLINSLSKNSIDIRSTTSLTKVPARVALQDQLRSVQQSEASIRTLTMKKLTKNAKARQSLRNEPQIGSGLNPEQGFESLEIHKSYSRLHALKINENLANERKQNAVDMALQQAKLEIPDLLAKRVPLHWHSFLDDANQELSQVTSKIYDGGVSKGAKHGQGQMILPSGDIYKGNWKNDLRHGSGICKFTNGAIYKGEWREGRPQGQGILFSPPNEIIEGRFEGWKIQDGIIKILFTNGEFYEGNMKDNQRENHGVMHYKNGDIFEGEWFKDKRGGKRGKITTLSGAKLSAQFIKDQADGTAEYEDARNNTFQTEADATSAENITAKKKAAAPLSSRRTLQQQQDEEPDDTLQPGTFYNGRLYQLSEVVYQNGDKFRGTFKDGRANGYGTLKYNQTLPGHDNELEEAEYKGNFKAGKRDGYGTMTWYDGSQFKGVWKGDKRESGEMIMSNGALCYRGGFQNDKLHGMASLLIVEKGVIFQGEFNMGSCASIGKILYPNGDMYFGQHKQFLKEGVGKMVYFDGSVYEGLWDQDRKNQSGRMEYAETGDVYVGEFIDGKRSGRGRYYSAADNTIYDGEWSNDRRQGEGTILNEEGQIASGEYRADQMEGKLTYQRTLSPQETERVFSLIKFHRDQFISVDAKAVQSMRRSQRKLTGRTPYSTK